MPFSTGYLTISPTTKPYKSSNLALPPTPFTPRLPIIDQTSPLSRPLHRPTRPTTCEFRPPPPEPLNWLWRCHKCHRVYRLSTTRRCLDDGHYFCAGTTTIKRSRKTGGKKVVRHQACASEFDYAGWKAWGIWRRDVLEQIEAARTLEEFLDFGNISESTSGDGRLAQLAGRGVDAAARKDCWNVCDYPSECRWGKAYGVATPVASSILATPQITLTPHSTPTMDAVPEQQAQTAFQDILFDMSDFTGGIAQDPLQNLDGTPETPILSPNTLTEDKKPSMDDLLAGVKRRKRKSAGVMPSPLASNPPSPVSSGSRSNDATSSPPPSIESSDSPKALDDQELDLRSPIGRVGKAVGNLFGVKSSTGRWGKKRNAAGTW